MRKFFSFGCFGLMFFLLMSVIIFMSPVTGVAYGGDPGCVIVGDLAIADNPVVATINYNYAANTLGFNSRGQENSFGQVPEYKTFTEVIRHDLIVRIGTAPRDPTEC